MCAMRCRTAWLAFYGNDQAETGDRHAFLARIEKSMAKY